ncbi:MAG: DUF4407 domain-containing protein [Flavobacteriales bacterium]|nr:DUF4407 domain-containing protein [Flavobacteriales bacterium]
MNLQEFFLICSGVDRTVLQRCPTETNKYVGIGGTVFFTALLASLAGGYALYTVFDSILVAILFGCVWGLMIFNLDRFIVSGIKNRGRIVQDMLIALPRVALAVVIAIVISRPVELRLFEKEINAELITMGQEKMEEQDEALRARFVPIIDSLNANNEDLALSVLPLTQRRDQLVQEAIAEADGTGGSQRRNMGPIYKAKRQEADKAEQELASQQALIAERVEYNQEQSRLLEGQMMAELEDLERVPYDGIAARMTALDRLTAANPAIHVGHLFIFLLFLLIESAPVLVKLMSRRSPYDFVLHKHEHEYEMWHKEKTDLLANATENKIKYQTQVDTHKVHARIREERAKIDHEVARTIEELKQSVSWNKG